MSTPKKSASTKGMDIYSGLFTLVVFVLALPWIISLTKAPLNWEIIAVVVLDISSTVMLITRPFSILAFAGTIGAVPAFQLFRDAMPAAETWFNATYATNSAVLPIGNYLTTYSLPTYLLVLPFFLLLLGAIRAGANTDEKESGSGAGARMAAKAYFGSIVGYGLVWGIVGIVMGTWTATLGSVTWPAVFIIMARLIASSWIDGILIFVICIALGAVGQVLGKKQVVRKAQKSPATLQKESAVMEVQAPLLIPAPRVILPTPGTHAGPLAPALAPEERYLIYNFCEMCGTRLDPQAIYCSGCGARVRKEVLTVSAPVPPTEVPTMVPVRVQAILGEQYPETPAISVAEMKKQKQLRGLENAIVNINRWSAVWAILFTVLSIIAGGITTGVTGNPYNVLAAVFLAPFGFFAAQKDQQLFQDKINNRNYASRGFDMFIVGVMGCVAGGAGFLILLKGILVFAYTLANKEEFPRLNVEQWEARIYQEANVYAAPLVALTTIGASSEFALISFPTALTITWTIIKILIGAAIYFAYVNYVKKDLVQGNFYNAEQKCFILGILGCIVNSGGLLILLQGIILYIHRTSQERAARNSPPVETATSE